LNDPNLTRPIANPSNEEEFPVDGRIIDGDIKVENGENRPGDAMSELGTPAISPLEHAGSTSSIEIGCEDDIEASIVVFAPYAKLLYGDRR
jgi:hypothetical protein